MASTEDSVSVATMLWSTATATAQIFAITAVGGLLAKTEVLSRQNNSVLTMFNTYVSMPALVFLSVALVISTDALAELWPIPVFTLINYSVGMSLSWLLAKLLRIEPRLQRLFIVTATTPNTTSIPFQFVDILCRPGAPLSRFPSAQALASAYISIYGSVTSFYLWVFCYAWIADGLRQHAQPEQAPPSSSSPQPLSSVETLADSRHETHQHESQQTGMVALEEDSSHATSLHDMKEAETSSPSSTMGTVVPRKLPSDSPGDSALAATTSSSSSSPSYSSPISSPATSSVLSYFPMLSDLQARFQLLVRDRPRLGLFLKQLRSPPSAAVLLGVFVGIVSPVKSLFFDVGDGGTPPLSLVTQVIRVLSEGAIGILLMILGASLFHNASLRFREYRSWIVGVTLVRLILMPALGFGFTWALARMLSPLLPDASSSTSAADLSGWSFLAASLSPSYSPVFVFVLLLEFGTPTNITLVLFANMLNAGEREVCSALLWTYLFSIPALSLYLMAILVYIL